MVTGFVFTFSPFSLPPAGSTTPQQIEGSIIAHQASSLVSIQFILSVQIGDTNLSLLLHVLFSQFHPFHPPAGSTPQFDTGKIDPTLKVQELKFV